MASILNNGKTILGGIITVGASLVAAVTPDDLTAVLGVLGKAHVGGQALIVLGLVHKLIKARQESSKQLPGQ